MSEFAKQFWERKILAWEGGRYRSSIRGASSLLERIADKASDSLRYRLEATAALLAPFVKGRSIIEVGCGSGLLAKALIDAGAIEYLGVDIARTAIEAGLLRKRTGRWPDCINFIQGEISSLPDNRHDIILSLGLLDWLNDEELKHLFRFQGRSDFFHAISERSNRIDQWLHRAYVQLSYGYRTGAYRPRYFSCAEIAALTPSTVQTYVHRHPRLRFGALLSSFRVASAQPVTRSR